MKSRSLALIGLCAVPLLAAFAAQERQKPKEATDMPAILQQVGKSWEAKQYGACLKSLRQAQVLAMKERVKVVRAALPNAPEGFEKVAPQENDDNAGNALAAAMAVGMGSVIEQTYQEKGGSSSVRVTITADSPYLQMVSMWITNPAMLEPGSEVVKYGPHNAVLKKQGDGWQLMILIREDLCDVTVDGRNDDFLLAMFNQAAVDKLAAALAN